MKYNGHCAYCGCDIEFNEMQIDHISPQMLGTHKNNDDENLNPSCKYCNLYKSNYTLEEFRYNLKNLLNNVPEYLFKSKTKSQIAINYRTIRLSKWDGKFFFEKIGG